MKRFTTEAQRQRARIWLWFSLCLCVSVVNLSAFAAEPAKPNIVLIFLDDSGHADFRPFGEPPYPTPNAERPAAEGTRFTQFYVPQAVCSASRAALMTGCYPGRVKVFGALRPGARGLEPEFKTMAEVLKPAGYATALFGKWHLGDEPDTQPQARGFDESCGLMYSNDMWAGHPENPKAWSEKPLQYFENGKAVIENVTGADQTQLTKRYTEHAVDFIQRHKAEPFFLYVPHSMPHVPLFASEAFAGKSGKGTHADVMMELDWSLGQILDALDAAGVSDNTVVIFTSDNGPWTVYGNHAGATPFREAKGTSFDGGTRSACVVRWPGKVPAGAVSDKAWSTIDVLPTLAKASGAPLPEYAIDGHDVLPLITASENATNPHDFYYFSLGDELQAIMTGDGQWKLHLEHKYRWVETPGGDGKPGKFGHKEEPLSLYNLHHDPMESKNVIAENAELAKRMQEAAEKHAVLLYKRVR